MWDKRTWAYYDLIRRTRPKVFAFGGTLLFNTLFCEYSTYGEAWSISAIHINMHTCMSYCLSIHYLNHMACDLSSLDFNRQLDGWSWWWCRWLISLSSWQQLSPSMLLRLFAYEIHIGLRNSILINAACFETWDNKWCVVCLNEK